MDNFLDQVLQRLSTSVRSLKIHQHLVQGIDHRVRFFLGERDLNWAPIILEMFKNKLETFEIENFEYPKFLSSICIEELGRVRYFSEILKVPIVPEITSY